MAPRGFARVAGTGLLASAMIVGCGSEPEAEASADDCVEYTRAVCRAVQKRSQTTCDAMEQVSPLLPPEACAAGLARMAYTEAKFAKMSDWCQTLVERLCTDVGPDSDRCALIRAQTPRFAPSQCNGMLEQYEVTLAQLRELEAPGSPNGG